MIGLIPQASAQKSTEPIAIVSAASYASDVLAPESIVSAFGTKLATATASATDVDPNSPGIQLPTTLAGTTVQIEETLAPLLFVSPRQINFIIPSEAIPPDRPKDSLISVFVEVTASDGTVSTGYVNILPAVPALFTYDGSGSGVPAGSLVRVKSEEWITSGSHRSFGRLFLRERRRGLGSFDLLQRQSTGERAGALADRSPGSGLCRYGRQRRLSQRPFFR